MPIKPGVLLGIAGGIIAALMGWVLPSVLQSSQQRVQTYATVETEKARRLLHEYNAALRQKSGLLDEVDGIMTQLGDAGVKFDVDVDDASALSEQGLTDYEAIHTAIWEKFQPTDWSAARPSRPQPSYGNVADQMKRGLAERMKLVNTNSSLLDEALKSVDGALSYSSGDVQGRSHVEANYLKGVILHVKGLAELAVSHALRREAMDLRAELVATAQASAAALPLKDMVAASKVDEKTAEINVRVQETETRLTALRAERERLEAIARELSGKLAAATQRAEAARQAIDQLRAAGINLANTNGAAEFDAKMTELDKAYRAATREAHLLQRGGMPRATLAAGGDLLLGAYVEPGATGRPTTERGLDAYQADIAVVNSDLARNEAALKDLQAAAAQLKTLRNSFAEHEKLAANASHESLSQTGELWSELSRIESEAYTAEDKALALFERAGAAHRDAAANADRATAAARERLKELRPAQQERAADNAAKDDQWISGYIVTAEADARLARAWVYQSRYRAYTDTARALADAVRLVKLAEADAAAEQTKADEARAAGVEEVGKAMSILSDAHRRVGQHWTITALGAGARNLMALFDYPEYRAQAIEDYRAALKDRADKDFAAWIVDRLSALGATP